MGFHIQFELQFLRFGLSLIVCVPWAGFKSVIGLSDLLKFAAKSSRRRIVCQHNPNIELLLLIEREGLHDWVAFNVLSVDYKIKCCDSLRVVK